MEGGQKNNNKATGAATNPKAGSVKKPRAMSWGLLSRKVNELPTTPEPEPSCFVSHVNQTLRRELFKKHYRPGRWTEFTPNETADAVECFKALLNEYHCTYDTVRKVKREKVLPARKQALIKVERCQCLVHQVF